MLRGGGDVGVLLFVKFVLFRYVGVGFGLWVEGCGGGLSIRGPGRRRRCQSVVGCVVWVQCRVVVESP